jgi:hypothetical protein
MTFDLGVLRHMTYVGVLCDVGTWDVLPSSPQSIYAPVLSARTLRRYLSVPVLCSHVPRYLRALPVLSLWLSIYLRALRPCADPALCFPNTPPLTPSSETAPRSSAPCPSGCAWPRQYCSPCQTSHTPPGLWSYRPPPYCPPSERRP